WTTLRWAIAIFGFGYVVSNISCYDRILLPSVKDGWPTAYQLAEPGREDSQTFVVRLPEGGTRAVARDELLVKSDTMTITVRDREGRQSRFDVLAQKVVSGKDSSKWPYLVTNPRNIWQRYWNKHSGEVKLVEPNHIVGPRP